MEWWEAILLGLVQGLTEFLPVSSSGHLMIARDLLGVDAEGFLDFTVTVHFATVLSTLIVFWGAIVQILKEVLKFKYNDGADYFLKLCVSMVPVALVGLFFKDGVETLFGETLTTVGVCLLVTAALLLLATYYAPKKENPSRNGISWWQALAVGVAQAFAVAPGLSRSGLTISTGLVCGVKKDSMAQFSFLMVLVPIIGEQALSLLKAAGSAEGISSGIGVLPLALGFAAAFASGLFACKVMVALVRRARFSWFALYCAVVGILVLILG